MYEYIHMFDNGNNIGYEYCCLHMTRASVAAFQRNDLTQTCMPHVSCVALSALYEMMSQDAG